MEQITITAADGYPLSALFSSPLRYVKGTIVISPAAGVKKEFYINFSRFLYQKGYAVLLYDYRGIGGSVRGNIRKSKISIHQWGTLDMNAVMQWLVEVKQLSDIIWLGHSMGAQLIGFTEYESHIKKVVAINAAWGYWKYFPAPMKYLIWFLWYFIGPLMVKVYGYGNMKLIGWGENLPKNALMEWRSWCLNENYFEPTLLQQIQKDRFYQFTRPITAIYMSDDFIANDKTVPMMVKFFPNAPYSIVKFPVGQYTSDKVGHTGIFRKKFRESLWPVLFKLIEGKEYITPQRKPFLPDILKEVR